MSKNLKKLAREILIAVGIVKPDEESDKKGDIDGGATGVDDKPEETNPELP